MYTNSSIFLSYLIGHAFLCMQMYEDAAAIGEITVTPEWVIRHVCNTMIGAMFIVSGVFMTLFPSLQRYPSPHMPRIGHVPYIFNIITCTVTAIAYYHIAKQTSNPIDIAYRSLSSYGIFWFIGGYITKWLRQMLDAKADQSKSTNVKPAVPTAKKTKLQDLEMGIKEAAS